jgi:hypothetical protein
MNQKSNGFLNDSIISFDKFYYYKANTLLKKNIDNYLNQHDVHDIKISLYKINNKCKYPFIEYLFMKNLDKNKLHFIELFINNIIDSEKIVDLSKIFTFGILNKFLNIKNHDDYNEKTIFSGFYIWEKQIYLFFDISLCNLCINDTNLKNDFLFVIIDEIINYRNTYKIDFDLQIVKFFIKNNDFCYLINDNNKEYELPIVAYISKEVNMLNYVFNCGLSPNNHNELFGSFFYFTNMDNALLEITDTKKGLVRFAVFTSKMKYIENYINDNIDDSYIKKERLLDSKLDQKYEHLTIRISDYFGKWIDNYDSIYLGNVLLDDDTYLTKTPIIVVKEFNQYVPLSYHYIN